MFNALGVKVMQITYMNANLAGQGLFGAPGRGADLIRPGTSRGDEPAWDFDRPVACGAAAPPWTRPWLHPFPWRSPHANPKRMADHPRNKTDREIEAVARTGGVVGATIFPALFTERETAPPWPTTWM